MYWWVLLSSGYEAAVYKIVTAGAERRCVGSKEVNQLGYLFGLSDFAARVERVFILPQFFDALVGALGALFEKVVDQRSVYGAGAYGIYADALRSEVYRETAGNLTQSSFGKPVCKTVRLADEPLVGCIDYHRTTAPLQ